MKKIHVHHHKSDVTKGGEKQLSSLPSARPSAPGPQLCSRQMDGTGVHAGAASQAAAPETGRLLPDPKRCEDRGEEPGPARLPTHDPDTGGEGVWARRARSAWHPCALLCAIPPLAQHPDTGLDALTLSFMASQTSWC